MANEVRGYKVDARVVEGVRRSTEEVQRVANLLEIERTPARDGWQDILELDELGTGGLRSLLVRERLLFLVLVDAVLSIFEPSRRDGPAHPRRVLEQRSQGVSVLACEVVVHGEEVRRGIDVVMFADAGLLDERLAVVDAKGDPGRNLRDGDEVILVSVNELSGESGVSE